MFLEFFLGIAYRIKVFLEKFVKYLFVQYKNIIHF